MEAGDSISAIREAAVMGADRLGHPKVLFQEV
jgi:hypothetical protein